MSEHDFPEVDYMGVELRIVSHFLKNSGIDPVPLDKITELIKDFVSEASTPEIRARRKAIVFGLVYGGAAAEELKYFLEDRINGETEVDPCASCTYDYDPHEPHCANRNCANQGTRGD